MSKTNIANNEIKVAIIPARYGSKRIKKKNIKNFYSKPMIYWTISKLLKSKFFDKIIVSSDSQKILNISRSYGADILINRPSILSGDKIATQPVIIHAIEVLEKEYNYFPEFVCSIYPCNPFLKKKDLTDSFNMLIKKKSKFVFPVAEYSHPIQRALIFNNKNNLTPHNSKSSLKRTQDLKKTYHDAGQFCWGTSKNWKKVQNIHGNALGLKIPSWRVVDIDNLSDWKRAEKLFKIFN